MIKHLFYKVIGNRKGVSGIIATIFMVTIVLFLYSGGFMFIQNQNRRLQEEVRTTIQLDIDSSSEDVRTLSVDYEVSANKVTIDWSIENIGPIQIDIVTFWILDITINELAFIDNINSLVEPAGTLVFEDSNASLVIIPGVHSDHNFTSWIVTARGNKFSLEDNLYGLGSGEVEDETPPVGAFGVFQLDWFTFNYTSDDYTTPRTAGAISKTEDYVAFYVNITNNYNETVTILEESMLMLLVEMEEPNFYIVEDVEYTTPNYTSDWSRTTTQEHSGSYSIQARDSVTYLTSKQLNTQDANNITVSFWYYDTAVDDYDNVYLQFWDGSAYDNIFELGNTFPENTWHYYTITTSDSQYKISDFRIRIDATSIDFSEYLYVDDLLITKNNGEEVTLISEGFESPTSGGSTLTDYNSGTPIIVNPYESTALIFAAESPSQTIWTWDTSPPSGVVSGNTPEVSIAMVALVFTMESDPSQVQAQSLPFRAILFN